MPHHSIPIFPPELISRILLYTSVQDVVRWRRVSKWFQSITHDPDIWKALHRNSPFLRPKKPLPKASFEDALVQSARLAHSWTTKPLSISSHFKVPLGDEYSETVLGRSLRIIGGKWLLTYQDVRRFVLYDVSATGKDPEVCGPQVVWKPEEAFSDWDVSIGAFYEGKWLVYVLLYMKGTRRWKLLEIHVDAESGAVCDTIDLDMPVVNPKGCAELDIGEKLCTRDYIYARSPFLWIKPQSLIFDTRTRIFYEFPIDEFRIVKHRVRPQVNASYSEPIVVLTNTHIIVIRPYVMFPCQTLYNLIQVFTVPDSQCAVEKSKTAPSLRLSHEGIDEHDVHSGRFPIAITRNSIVDPQTGSTSVKLLERSKWEGFGGCCTELTLQEPPSVDVAPIQIEKTKLVITGDMPPHPIDQAQNAFYDICDEGYARGFFTLEFSNKRSGVIKFELDATGRGCVANLSPFSPVDLGPIWHSDNLFDGGRGRFYYIMLRDEDPLRLTVTNFE